MRIFVGLLQRKLDAKRDICKQRSKGLLGDYHTSDMSSKNRSLDCSRSHARYTLRSSSSAEAVPPVISYGCAILLHRPTRFDSLPKRLSKMDRSVVVQMIVEAWRSRGS